MPESKSEKRESHELTSHQAAIEALYKSIEFAAKYPVGHPLVTEALDFAAITFGSVTINGDVEFQISLDGFLVEGTTIPSSKHLGVWASSLHKLGIASITIKKGIVNEEILRLIETINVSKQDSLYGPAIVELLTATQATHVSLASLKFNDGNFVDTVDADKSEDACARWRDAIARVLQGIDQLDDIDATELARTLNQLQVDGGDIDSFMSQIAEALQAIKRDGTDPSQIGCWLGVFVLTLAPELRSKLLALSSLGDEEVLSAVEQNLDPASIMEFVDVLRNIDLKDNKFSSTAMRLLRKMSSQADGIQGATDAIQELMSEWGIESEEITQQIIERSIESLCSNEDAELYSPDDYRNQLDRLASHRILSRADAESQRYINPNNDKDVLEQAAAVNVHLLEHFQGSRLDQLFNPFIKVLDLLIRRKRFDLISKACAVAVAQGLSAEDDPTLANMTEFVSACREPVCVERLVQIVVDSASSAPNEANQILQCCGRRALLPVMIALANAHDRCLINHLIGFIQSFDEDTIADECCNAVRSTRSSQLTTMCFSELSKENCRVLADRLSEDSSTAIRQILFETIAQQWSEWPDHIVRRGLSDTCQQVIDSTLDFMTKQIRNADTVPLSEFIDLQKASDQSAVANIRKACLILTQSQPGLSSLEDILASLSWKISGNHAAKGAVIANVLIAHSTKSSSRRVVARWRRNPANWVGRLFIKDRLAS